MTTKTCRTCELDLPLDDFGLHKQTRDGRNSSCKGCVSKNATAWNQANPERHKATHQRWRDSPRGKERIRAYKLRDRYGITPEEYDEALERQGNACAICGTSFDEVPIHSDHDHQTNRFRELLCPDCNHGLGRFKDDVERLLSAALYLIKHGDGEDDLRRRAEDRSSSGLAADLRQLLSGG